MNKHELIEMMATTWDAAGHRPPSAWRYACTCGATVRDLPGQIEVMEAWAAHRAPVAEEAR